MKRRYTSLLVPGLLVAGSAPFPPAGAVDHGQFGEAWPVTEPDLLLQIQARLQAMEASGELARQNERFRQRVESRVMDPAPLPGIGRANENRTWLFDPAMTLAADMRDDKGSLIAAAGTRVNPLDHIAFEQKLIFVDGRDEDQLVWAKEQATGPRDKIVFTGGSPFRSMRAHQMRFYFDQGGALTSKFGISSTPALVEREGDALRVSEFGLPKARAR